MTATLIKLTSKFIQTSENPLLVGPTWVSNGEWAIKQTALYHALSIESAKKRYQAVAATFGIDLLPTAHGSMLDTVVLAPEGPTAYEPLDWIYAKPFPIRVLRAVDGNSVIGIKESTWALFASLDTWHVGGLHSPILFTPSLKKGEAFSSSMVVAVVGQCVLPIKKWRLPT